MGKRKTDPDERPPPPVTGRTFQKIVNEEVLPSRYAALVASKTKEAEEEARQAGLSGSAARDFVQARLDALPRGEISVRTARRWLRVCARVQLRARVVLLHSVTDGGA